MERPLKICVFTTHGNLYYSTQLLKGFREYSQTRNKDPVELTLITTEMGKSEIKYCMQDTSGIQFLFIEKIMDRSNFLKLLRYVIHVRPDVFHMQNIMGVFTYPFLIMLRLASIRTVITMHNVTSHEGVKIQDLGFFGILPFCHSIIVHDRVLKIQLSAKYHIPAHKIHSIPHGNYFFYNQERFSQKLDRKKIGLEPNHKVILFFGLIRPYKGVEILIQALKRIVDDKEMPVKLLLVGKNFLPDRKIERMISDLDLTKNVVLVDKYVPIPEVQMYFRESDVVVLPYVKASQSGVAQVAFAFEKPVVATRVGALPSIIRSTNGRLVPPENPIALAHAIGEILDDPQLAKNLGRKGFLEAREKFSWVKIARKTLKAYQIARKS